MKAHIKPLDGKYYGTVVEYGEPEDVADGLGSREMWEHEITIWCFRGDPSARQLAEYDMTMADKGSEMWDDLCSDNHFETALSYSLAEAIVKAIESVPDIPDPWKRK